VDLCHVRVDPDRHDLLRHHLHWCVALLFGKDLEEGVEGVQLLACSVRSWLSNKVVPLHPHDGLVIEQGSHPGQEGHLLLTPLLKPGMEVRGGPARRKKTFFLFFFFFFLFLFLFFFLFFFFFFFFFFPPFYLFFFFWKTNSAHSVSSSHTPKGIALVDT